MSSKTPNYSAGNDRFNDEASTYDQKHNADQAALRCCDALAERIPELKNGTSKRQGWTAIELGAGTGLLSRALLRYFPFVLGVDPSEGMLKEFEKKSIQAKEEGLGEIKGVKSLLEDPNDPALEGRKFNLAVSQLVFHHLPEMQPAIDTLSQVLVPGGILAVSDFINDENSIRGKGIEDGVHRHGLVPEEMKEMFEKAGLKDVKVEKSFSLEMKLGDGHGHGDGHGNNHNSEEKHGHHHHHHHEGEAKTKTMNFMLITGRKP